MDAGEFSASGLRPDHGDLSDVHAVGVAAGILYAAVHYYGVAALEFNRGVYRLVFNGRNVFYFLYYVGDHASGVGDQ